MRLATAAFIAVLLGAAPTTLWAGAGVESSIVIVDFSKSPDVGAGKPFAKWLTAQSPDWSVEFGSPDFFFIQDGRLVLRAAPGPKSRSWNPVKLSKREDKIILRIRGGTGTDFRLRTTRHPTLELRMVPLVLPGKGADITDSGRNDACFYLLVSFDGPLHTFIGTDGLPDTIGYVWTDARLPVPVGRDPDYETVMRYISIGAGSEGLGVEQLLSRNLPTDYRAAFPEHRSKPIPDIVRIGLMIDSNTVGSTAESSLRSIRFLPAPPRQ